MLVLWLRPCRPRGECGVPGVRGGGGGKPAALRDTIPPTMLINGVNFPMDRIAEICRRYGAAKLSLFGSILSEPSADGRYGFRPSSDVDILVEFDPAAQVGLIGLASMEADLSDAIGRVVDLRTAGDLSKYFRDEVVTHARLLHAA